MKIFKCETTLSCHPLWSLPNTGDVRCLASCATAGVYQILQRNEASKKLKHHRVKGFDVNFLGSNSPIEDRFVIGSSHNLGASFFSVIDGHKGYRCSHYLQNHMLQHISAALHKAGNINSKDDFRILLSMNSSTSHTTQTDEVEAMFKDFDSSVISECLQQSLSALDDSFCNAALEDIKQILKGHSLTPEMKQRLLTAIEGACAITAVVRDRDIFVANTGDSRVVIGQEMPNSKWKAVQLSDDQNAHNEAEVKRLKDAHPGEVVIFENRVLGSLMPFRTFGDVDFKWEKKYLSGFVTTWMNYETPPYITAEPVVTHRTIESGDRFLIIGSDGLWERISNEEAVNIVGGAMKKGKITRKQSLIGSLLGSSEECCDHNAATRLLWHVLGGSEKKVAEMLSINSRLRRMYRDDITIIVVYL